MNPAETAIKLETPDGGYEEWYQCPRRPLLDDPEFFTAVSRLYSIKGEGFLPFPGSYMEQPALLVQSWGVLDRTVAEVQRFIDKKSKARAAAGGQRP